jgi:exonuclease III
MMKQQYMPEVKSMRNKSKVEVLSQDEIDLLLAETNAGESINSFENIETMELSALPDDLTGRVAGSIDVINHLKILSWNCHYGLNLEKYLAIMEYKPEVLILQECTKTDFEFIKSKWEYGNWYNDALYSHDRGLGLAILSNECKINFTEIFNRRFRYMIPYELTWNDERFTVFITWINPTDKKNYDEHLYDAIDYYRNKGMLNEKSIVIGDFNTFVKGDKDLKLLEEKMLPLVNCPKEAWFPPTYCHALNSVDDIYMGVDDFCFVSEDMINNFIIHINRLSVWDKAQDKDNHWKGLSDHCPIIVDLQGRTDLARIMEEQGGAG